MRKRAFLSKILVTPEVNISVSGLIVCDLRPLSISPIEDSIFGVLFKLRRKSNRFPPYVRKYCVKISGPKYFGDAQKRQLLSIRSLTYSAYPGAPRRGRLVVFYNNILKNQRIRISEPVNRRKIHRGPFPNGILTHRIGFLSTVSPKNSPDSCR